MEIHTGVITSFVKWGVIFGAELSWLIVTFPTRCDPKTLKLGTCYNCSQICMLAYLFHLFFNFPFPLLSFSSTGVWSLLHLLPLYNYSAISFTSHSLTFINSTLAKIVNYSPFIRVSRIRCLKMKCL